MRVLLGAAFSVVIAGTAFAAPVTDATVAFLMSPDGANVSGQSIGVCGNVESL